MFPALVWSRDVHPAHRAEREGGGQAAPELQGGGPRQDDEVGPAESRLEPSHDGLEEVEGRAEVGVDLPVPAGREKYPGPVTAAPVVCTPEG